MDMPSSPSQFKEPRGLQGHLVLWLMALKNGGMNRAALRALMPLRGEAILEIGTGPGVALRSVARRVGRDGFVAGVDHAPLAVAATRHRLRRAIRHGRAEVMRASADSLPFTDGRFVKAFAVNSAQFWPGPEESLKEVARVLRPGGRLVLTQRAADGPVTLDLAHAAGGYERVERLSAAMPAAGFRILDVAETMVGRLIAVTLTAQRSHQGPMP